MNPQAFRSFLLRSLRLFCCLLFSVVLLSAAEGIRKTYDVPAGPAEQSLKTFSAQSGMEVLFATKTTGKVQTNAVRGDYTAREAVDQMLDGTGLKVAQDTKTGAFTVTSDPNGARVALTEAATRTEKKNDSSSTTESGALKLETFEVFGRKTLNMDIYRTQDDAQPYYVIDSKQIERVGAINVEDLLKQQLSMNTTQATNSQIFGVSQLGSTSAINLRGLGSNQTLILVDGRRMAGVANSGNSYQPDLNGIPLSAIERIEVLPTSASAIYGGAAVGGVVNLVMKRNYNGGELKYSIDQALQSDSTNQTFSGSYGFSLNQGKTQVMISGSMSEGTPLYLSDRRGLVEQRIQTIIHNAPLFFNGSNPFNGASTNVALIGAGSLTLKNGTSLGSNITHVPTGTSPGANISSGLLANAGG